MPEGNITAGLDEVGKGSLFGPVFASAVVLNKESETVLFQAGLKDSKQLSSRKRAHLEPLIKKTCIAWGLGQASSNEIDSKGIRVATELAMMRAIQKLQIKPDFLLIDGNLPLRLWSGAQKTLICGENKSAAIAAASVLAKESRDALIKRLALKFPYYGLETNVGYGTKVHRNSLIKHGRSELHRKTFLTKII